MSSSDPIIASLTSLSPVLYLLVERLLGPRYVRKMKEEEAEGIKNIARAQGEATIIEAEHRRKVALIDQEIGLNLEKWKQELSVLQQRGLKRVLDETARDQECLETIVAASLPQIDSAAPAERVSPDWLDSFSRKARLVSDTQMQELWSRILAGEINQPGSFSKRTISFLADLDKSDAALFASLCAFVVELTFLNPHTEVKKRIRTPIILNDHDDVYLENQMGYDGLAQLESLGVISMSESLLYESIEPGWKLHITHGGESIGLGQQIAEDRIVIGLCKFTRLGSELERICTPTVVPGVVTQLLAKMNEILPSKRKQ